MSRDRYAQCDDTCTVDCGACKGAGRPTADLTPAQAARLDEIERVARAMHVAHLEARVVGDPPTPTIYTYRRLAVAAIDVMRGAADDGAIGRVLALADELDTEASECRDLGRRYREGDKWTGAAVCDAKSWTSKDAAARIRAAVNEVTT